MQKSFNDKGKLLDSQKLLSPTLQSPVETNITFVLEFTHITTENLVSREPFLAVMPILCIVPVWLFFSVSGGFQAVCTQSMH